MSDAADPLTLLARALDQMSGVLARVDDSDLDAPTPCRSWDVHTLINHVLHDLENFTVAATGGRPDYRAEIPEVTADRAAAFRAGAATLLETWRSAGDLNRTVTLPIGEVPVSFLVHQQIGEFAVHAWDIATATRASVDWDDKVAMVALEWMRATLKPEFRGDEASGKAFGPEIEAPPGASPQERLVAFAGRHPA